MQKISTLKIEPNLVPVEDGRYQFPFWKIVVDDYTLSEHTLPFKREHHIIELFGSLNFPYWGDGSGYISVRRAEQYILWMDLLPADDDELSYLTQLPALNGEVIAFAADQYLDALSHASINISFEPRLRAKSEELEQTELPELSQKEWREIFHFPEPNDALYRIPEDEIDRRGALIIRRTAQAIKESQDEIGVCDPPDKWMELRVGLDLPDYPEVHWQIGKINDMVAIRFVQYPDFPLWVCVKPFEKALKNETFLQE